MPRRASAAKKLNNSTDLDGQAATKSTDLGAAGAAKQPQHKVKQQQQQQQQQTTTVTGSGMKSLASSKQNVAGGEATNDTRSSAPNVPQHRQLASQQVFVNPIGSKPREEQIQAILEHRKLLLKRIRQSRGAAEKRLTEPSKRTIVSTLADATKSLSSSGGNTDSTKTAAASAIGDEVEAYKELSRLAAQAAKKQRQEEQQPAEKRVSVSLRRGSQVGKRMSQALSVLTPGATETTNAVAAAPVAPPPVAVPPPVATTSMGTKKLKTSTSIGKQMGEVKKRSSQKKSASRMSVNVPPPYGMPPIMPEPPPPPKPAVVFPEAIALRERKAAVRSKLSALIETKRKRLEQEMKPQQAQRIAALAKGGSILPSDFPKRRKTQWDYVLEEMRWLSTDFIEERKWKAASGRVLSSAVKTFYNEKEEKEAAAVAACKAEKKVKNEKVIEDEKKDADEDVVMEDASKKVSESDTEVEPVLEKKVSCGQRFVNPSEDDITLLQAHAKKMSGMVSELWEGVLASGPQWSKPMDIQAKGKPADSEQKENPEASPVHNAVEETTSKDEPTSAGVVSPEDDMKKKKTNGDALHSTVLSNDDITDKIKALMNRIEKRPRQRARSKKSSSKAKLTISPAEQKATDFVEYLWKATEPAGAMLGDAYSFSPIDVAISLLRQHKKEGPHVVLCPPSRMLYWSNELKRTNAVGRVLLLSGVDNGEALEDFATTDIVVANLSATGDQLDLSKFESVVLDGNVTLGNSKSISVEDIRDGIHPELLSEEWWNAILRAMSTKIQRRLLIANSFLVKTEDDEAALLQRLTEKERLDYIAGATSFVYGPDIFQSDKKSHLHRVLGWAKSRVKEKEASKGRVKIQQIESHLVNLLSSLMFAPENHFETVQQSFEEKAIFDTEILLCKMSPAQQASYDTLCRNLRGALSLGGSLVDAARGFMQLREVCFHARLRDVCNSMCNGPSQPDLHKAVDIMNESAKLKELIVLLHRDFGYDVEGIELLEELIPDLQPKSKRSSKPLKDGIPKVAIVASSPLVQRLTSVLLSSLGIDHENLAEKKIIRRSGSRSLSTSIAEADFAKTGEGSQRYLPWLERQLSLFRYNNTDVDHNGFPFPSKEALVTRRSANIILGSTMNLATRESGLAVEASDIVVFIDEDWSGRESQLVKQILVRCFLHKARHEVERADFRVYRFVCDDCCEEKLLCGFQDNENTEELEATSWSVNGSGLLQLEPSLEVNDETFGHFAPDYVFEFPGRNLASFESQELASFLGTKEPLPANLESGKELLFLPFKTKSSHQGDESASRESILSFVQELIREENELRSVAMLLGMGRYGKSVPTSVTMQNMFVAESRYYIQRFGRDGSSSLQSDGSATLRANSSYFGSDAGASSGRDASDTVDGPYSDGKMLTADEVNASILFYPSGDSENRSEKRKAVASSNTEKPSAIAASRANLFSTAYTRAARASESVWDGSQGCEPLPYFPPLFPSLRQIAGAAASEVSRMRQNKRQRLNNVQTAPGTENLKRPLDVAPGARVPDPKRPRVDALGVMTVPLPASTAPQALLPAQPVALGIPPSSFVPGTLNNVVAPPVNPVQFNGRLLAPSEADVSFGIAKQTLMDLDEDFGILGVGALPIQSQFAGDGGVEIVDLSDYRTVAGGLGTHDLLSSTLSCDFEETESSNTNTNLGAMILFVPRKSSPMARPMHAGSPAHAALSQMPQWNASMSAMHPATYMGAPGMNGMGGDSKSNGAPATKKIKRKSNTPTSFSAGAPGLPPGHPGRPGADFSANHQAGSNLSSALSQAKGKDALRYKILATYGRQGYGSPGLLESSQFRLASIRVRERIRDRVSASISTITKYHVQPQNRLLPSTKPWQAQLQAHSPPQWTSLVASAKKVDSSNVLLQASKSTDFGPFLVGNLPSVSDITNIPHPKPGVGLGLPMGVKIPAQQPIHAPATWTLREDKRLHMFAVRFGMNWHLVSCNMVGTKKSLSKSARHCRERWHTLAKSNPSLFNDMEEVRHAEMSAMQLSKQATPGGDSPLKDRRYQRVALDATMQSTEEELAPRSVGFDACLAPAPPSKPEKEEATVTQPKKRRPFAALRTASVKKHEVPMVIPGVVAGQKPSLAASHPSHHQSLQAAVAALSPGGRTEMWPLQILDLADKQRKAASRQSAAARSPHRSSGSYQATQSRHVPTQQPYVAPGTQPPAHPPGIPPQSQPSSGK